MKREVLVVIPARYGSSRYPGKPLVSILGVPLIIRVARLAAAAVGVENVVIATDDDRIAKVATEHNFEFVMTGDCPTGTDRVHEVATKLEAEIYINVQGDEPMIRPDDIIQVLRAKKAHPSQVVNAYTAITDSEDPTSINIPKVVVTPDNQMMYMSRLAIPGQKGNSTVPKQKQVCIYAFNKEELTAYAMSPRTPVEASEDIEIIRFLELGFSVKMVELDEGSLAVDVPEDVEKVEVALKARGLVD